VGVLGGVRVLGSEELGQDLSRCWLTRARLRDIVMSFLKNSLSVIVFSHNVLLRA